MSTPDITHRGAISTAARSLFLIETVPLRTCEAPVGTHPLTLFAPEWIFNVPVDQSAYLLSAKLS